MKRIFAILAACMLMTGCADTTELGDRAIIQLAAIDYENGEYTLNALLFSAGGEGGKFDVTQTNVIKVTGTGKTLGEAVQSLSLIDGKEIYMSEAKLVVLGSGFEQADISSALTMLYRDMRCSLNMPVCCADNAELLTDLEFTEGITAAEKPLDMIENAFLSGVSPKATLLDVLSDCEGKRPTLIPSFAETFNGSGMTKDEKGRTAEINGCRVIENGKLTKSADKNVTAGAMLLLGKADSTRVSISTSNDELTCEAYDIEAVIKNGKPHIKAHYRTLAGEGISQQEEAMAHDKLIEITEQAVDFVINL